MKYSRFEQLVLAVGGIAILGSFALALPNQAQPEPVEIVGQLLFFAVLAAAVFFGRRGGLVAAIAASAIYIVWRVPLNGGPLPQTLALVLTVRLATYGLLGIAGGEACSRLKYAMTRLEGRSALDDWSHVYNQAYAARSLEQSLGRFRRYQEAFSVVLLSLSPSLFAEFKPGRQRALVRGVADHIRADVRMVDEISRLEDGRFIVILPHTPAAGAAVVSERLATIVRRALGARDEAVSSTALSAAENEAALEALLLSIDRGYSASDEYNSDGLNTRNPAAESTSSAR